MSDNKFQKFYVDWFNIRKSSIYTTVFLVVFFGGLIGGGWWLYKSDWLNKVGENQEIPKDAAELITYEGDVRIIRAATRETIVVTRPTYVSAGDTIQTQNDGRAQIKMIDGSILYIRPNSTVVIRDSSSIFGGTDVRVTLDDGQINVKTQDQTENTRNVVELNESESRLLSQTDASFKTGEQGGEIRISRGGVETNVGGEKTILQGD
ncbi:MAG: FecR domain-containing protein, partial [Pyrinomonadaceae bacterium]